MQKTKIYSLLFFGRYGKKNTRQFYAVNFTDLKTNKRISNFMVNTFILARTIGCG